MKLLLRCGVVFCFVSKVYSFLFAMCYYFNEEIIKGLTLLRSQNTLIVVVSYEGLTEGVMKTIIQIFVVTLCLAIVGQSYLQALSQQETMVQHKVAIS